jgi:hypothetical protein
MVYNINSGSTNNLPSRWATAVPCNSSRVVGPTASYTALEVGYGFHTSLPPTTPTSSLCYPGHIHPSSLLHHHRRPTISVNRITGPHESPAVASARTHRRYCDDQSLAPVAQGTSLIPSWHRSTSPSREVFTKSMPRRHSVFIDNQYRFWCYLPMMVYPMLSQIAYPTSNPRSTQASTQH